MISIYYGEDASEEKAEELAAAVEELYPDCEVELTEADSRFIITLFL